MKKEDRDKPDLLQVFSCYKLLAISCQPAASSSVSPRAPAPGGARCAGAMGSILVGQGAVGGLVGQAVGQAFLARADLLAAVDVEQAHVGQQLAAGLADELLTRSAGRSSSTITAMSSSTGGKAGTGSSGKRRGTAASSVQVKFGCQHRGGAEIVVLLDQRVQFAEHAQPRPPISTLRRTCQGGRRSSAGG